MFENAPSANRANGARTVLITELPTAIFAFASEWWARHQGVKAQPFQPLFAAVSCLIWVIYGWTKEPKKDWILIIPTLIFIDENGRAKVDIALARGKKEYDKRQTLKEKEDN